jgi:RNA polymerase sigma-70 factor (ECF subfamily)
MGKSEAKEPGLDSREQVKSPSKLQSKPKRSGARTRRRKKQTMEERDRELVRLAKKGDTGAFGQLMLEYQNKIYRLARRMTETDEDAEDVLQEAFIKAFKSLSGFKGKSKFSTWLYRITVNLALMKLRRKKIDSISLDEPVATDEGSVQREIEDEAMGPLEELIESESMEVLDEAINELPKNYRAVFVLRHVEGLSTEETAKIVGISVPAVKSRLHRTRLLLREKLLGHLKNQTNRRNRRRR